MHFYHPHLSLSDKTGTQSNSIVEGEDVQGEDAQLIAMMEDPNSSVSAGSEMVINNLREFMFFTTIVFYTTVFNFYRFLNTFCA